MITVRPSSERGKVDLGWLDSKHTFSFGSYQDPDYMGFRSLRVINEDRVKPGQGFATHGHADMEIISYIIEGALEHKDSMGNGSVMRDGEVQRMTAGTGVRHSEFNPSADELVHFLQIWIIPEKNGLEPGYEQTNFSRADKHNNLRLIASPQGRNGSVTVHQSADFYASVLDKGESVAHSFDDSRSGWIQLVSGVLDVGGNKLVAGDGAAVENQRTLTLSAVEDAEVLLFDLL
jgi:redox-sensitive bicupin YhaK (pirin superfamily)